MATQWGRKETVIWPPQVPIYTIGTTDSFRTDCHEFASGDVLHEAVPGS